MSFSGAVRAARDLDLFGRELHYRVFIPASVVLLALAAALSYALAAALQHAATQEAPSGHSMRFRLLAHLIRRPMWLAGNVADGLGFVLLFLAFRRGSLILVQPLLVSGLLFALAIGTLITHHHVRAKDWTGALLVVAGLSTFLVAAAPGPGHPEASAAGWAGLGAFTAVAVGLLVASGYRRPDRRAELLGGAAGLLNGVLAAITEAAARTFDAGILPALQRWQPYALVAVGIVAILVVQSAFHAGKLSRSLPLLTATETAAGIAIGHLLFGEHVAGHPIAHIFQIAGLGVLCWGVFLLGDSPAAMTEDVEQATI